jgi:hypothetical protein
VRTVHTARRGRLAALLNGHVELTPYKCADAQLSTGIAKRESQPEGLSGTSAACERAMRAPQA